MNKRLNRIKTQIDFGATRGHLNSSLIFTTLVHYNRGSSTNMTASELIGEAFSFYDPTELADITLLIDAQTRSKAFIESYKIESRESLLGVVKKTSPLSETTIIEPGKKFFCLDGDNPSIKELWSLMEGMRYRDRAAFINKILFQYFAHGYCSFYNALCAERLLLWMKDQIALYDGKENEKIQHIADIVWDNAGLSEELIEIDNIFREAPRKGDDLRIAIGLI